MFRKAIKRFQFLKGFNDFFHSVLERNTLGISYIRYVMTILDIFQLILHTKGRAQDTHQTLFTR